jgi:hypothetical protein
MSKPKIKTQELKLKLHDGSKVNVAAVPVQDMPKSVGYIRFEQDGEYIFSIDCKDLKALKFLEQACRTAIKTAPSVK